jgi:hypothetical protein
MGVDKKKRKIRKQILFSNDLEMIVFVNIG